MHYEKFYRWCATLPVIALAMAVGVGMAWSGLAESPINLDEMPEVVRWTAEAIAVLGFSLVIAGVPYFVFVVALFVMLRGRSPKEYFWASISAPALFALFLPTCLGLFEWISRGSVPSAGAWFLFAPPSVGLGSLYVIVVHAARTWWFSLDYGQPAAA